MVFRPEQFEQLSRQLGLFVPSDHRDIGRVDRTQREYLMVDPPETRMPEDAFYFVGDEEMVGLSFAVADASQLYNNEDAVADALRKGKARYAPDGYVSNWMIDDPRIRSGASFALNVERHRALVVDQTYSHGGSERSLDVLDAWVRPRATTTDRYVKDYIECRKRRAEPVVKFINALQRREEKQEVLPAFAGGSLADEQYAKLVVKISSAEANRGLNAYAARHELPLIGSIHSRPANVFTSQCDTNDRPRIYGLDFRETDGQFFHASFTAPLRRPNSLANHLILDAFLRGESPDVIQERSRHYLSFILEGMKNRLGS